MPSVTPRFVCLALLLALVAAPPLALADDGAVNQSAREIPVAYDVDVVVVGGGVGACAAAIEASEQGADVFLMAPYPYLGDDMTATLRLWLEEGETPTDPLAQAIFSDPVRPESIVPSVSLPFTYEASIASSPKHKDGDPPVKLRDGKSSDASRESVQYDGDVTIIADLQAKQDLSGAQLLAFYRGDAAERDQNFEVDSVTVSISDDKQTWTEVGVAGRSDQALPTDSISRLTAKFDATARYVKLDVKKADDVDRILLGELVLLPKEDETPQETPEASPPPRPLHVKRVLDNALLEAGVKFLYSTYPTDVIRDAKGDPCGLVMVNRSGRQAVLAKQIIDATPRADVARMAGAEFKSRPSNGKRKLQYVVIGGEPREIPNGSYEIKGVFQGPWPNKAGTSSGEFPIINYTIEVDMADESWGSWCDADDLAHALTYHEEQQFTADQLFEVPGETIQGFASEKLRIPYASRDVKNVFVLGGCADVSRDVAADMLRPLAMIDLGRKLGAVSADFAAKIAPSSDSPRVAGPDPVANPRVQGDVGEVLIGVRPTQELPTIPCPAQSLPVLGRYDVVVVGGGTTGAPAGIASAREGAKTLVVEYLHTLGGVGTAGAISSYYWGNKVGFTASVPGEGRWVIEQRMHFWRDELLKAGGDLWCGTLGCGAFVDGDRVRGVVVTTPQGRGVVLCDVVIDATGCSDVAYAAGAECMYTDEKELAVQGTGLSPRELGASYANTDFTLVDETDAVDVWHVFIYAKDKYAKVFDQAKLIDTRERRRIIGEYVMTLLDQINHRTYSDTVSVHYSNFDTHGYTTDPYAELEHPEKVGHYVSMPYRCTLPKNLRGILVGGLGVSCERDAIPLVRMEADMQNLGYGLGTAAAMASEAGVLPRDVDMPALQEKLIAVGNLPESVLTDTDNYEVTDEQLAEAIKTIPDEFHGVQVLMWAPRDKAHAAVRAAFQETDDAEAKAAYAQVLAVMGDPIGVDLLIDKVKAAKQWDAGWNYRGMGQFGSALSPLDRLIVALGRAGDSKAIPVIAEKMRMLAAEDDFSHHRACALALELLSDREAAPMLAEHLTKPGMTGHVHDTLEKARAADAASPGGTNAVQSRRDSIRELATARALYRCGDYNDLGREVLEAYVDDLRGHFSRHAKAVLETDKPVRDGEKKADAY